MNKPERVCAFYSHGPHFRRLLRDLRNRYPEARLTALVPPGYPEAHIAGLADEIARTEQTNYSARDWKGIRRLLKQIRAGNCDVFVVMFDSPRLRILSALTRAPRRYCYTADGRYFRARLSLLAALGSTLYRRIRGHLTYACIRWVVYHRPVKGDGE
ncbi:MAG: glycosyltransferase family 9 protein [Candidatus Hydrogenedentota bacterium]